MQTKLEPFQSKDGLHKFDKVDNFYQVRDALELNLKISLPTETEV